MILRSSLLVLAGGIAGAAAGAGDWTALPTPRLCEPAAVEAIPSPLYGGSHLLHVTEGPGLRSPANAAKLPLALVIKILEEESGRGPRLELFKSSASILARGDAAAVGAARATIAELERAADALAIDLQVDLVGGPRPADPAGKAKERGDAPEHWSSRRRVRSGDEAFFGSRAVDGFVMTFEVEVAADSGIASPVLGSACTGRTLHLRAARVDGGRRVRLEGLLDLADLAAVDRFDPETSDLGIVQEPALDFVQIAFAGVVESGGSLDVQVSGAPLARPDWKLAIRAVTRPDEDPSHDSAFDVLDLAAIAAEAMPLQAPGPGAVLDRQAPFVPPRARTAAIPGSAIAAALDARGGDTSPARPSITWSDELLVLRRSDERIRGEAHALVVAAEAALLSTCRIEARRGALAASFPACSGSPARLLAGRERTALVGYRVQVAPQTWMAAPDVAKVFDGVALDASVVAGDAECSLWIAESAPTVVAARKDAQIGKLQVLARSLRSESSKIVAGEPEQELCPHAVAGGASDALFVRCSAP